MQELPIPMPVKTRLPPEIFGDALMVLEFLHAFGELFDLQDEFPEGVTLGKLSFMWQGAPLWWFPFYQPTKDLKCTQVPLLENFLCGFNLSVLTHAYQSSFQFMVNSTEFVKSKLILVYKLLVYLPEFLLVLFSCNYILRKWCFVSTLSDTIIFGIYAVNYGKVT